MANKEELFNKIVQQCKGSVYRLCKAYLYDKEAVDDLYQEVLIRLWANMEKFKGESEWSTYVYRIAVNTAISFNRKYKPSQPLNENFDAISESSDEKKENEDRLNHLHYCISLLEAQDRLIITLMLEELSYKEIADITGSTVTNVGVKINRIKQRLLKLMQTNTQHG